MTTRRINLDTGFLPDPKRIAWIEANGLDPRSVPAKQEVLIEDGQLTFIEFVFNEQGNKFLSENNEGYEKRQRTVPLISAPEAHGL